MDKVQLIIDKIKEYKNQKYEFVVPKKRQEIADAIRGKGYEFVVPKTKENKRSNV